MSKFQIAGFVVEYEPKYDVLKELSKPFLYVGEKEADFTLLKTDVQINSLLARMVKGSTIDQAEEFVYAGEFNRHIIRRQAMLVHSSAILVGGKAYLFSADSGVGKSTHTRLWKQLYGDEVLYINDDRPVVKFEDGVATAYGTPFDGGSGIANNISAPLGGIIFLERGEENSIYKITSAKEILQKLYFSTIHFVNKDTANSMLSNFDKLIKISSFYKLVCNMQPDAAKLAHDFLIR